MIRTPRTSPTRTAPRSLAGSVLRRGGGTVLAASLGALATTVVLSMTTGAPDPVQDARSPDRTGERPSRGLDRDASPHPAAAVLLPASSLARPSGTPARFPWRAVHTEPHEPRTLAASCHRFPLVSVGALRVAHRAYASGRGARESTAVHVVARFADARTAVRARRVLLAWQAGCREDLSDRAGLRVFPAHDLRDGAVRYALAWRSPVAGRVREDVALARVGGRVTLVRVTGPPASGGSEAVAAAVRSARTLLLE